MEDNNQHSLKKLLEYYKGHYHKFILSGIFYAIKHSPAWALPIVIANIVNHVIGGESNGLQLVLLNAGVMVGLVLLNIPMNYLHTHFRSFAIRSVEANLRNSLIQKLQQLSITYHKDMEAGRLQSKIMRDVENVETLSSQLFVNLLNISINIIVALSVTVFKNRIVFIFFILIIPVAATTIVAFRKKINKQNHQFRKEMEETSVKVMEMVEMIPITKAHSLEEYEVEKMGAQVSKVAEEGYHLDIIQANFGSVSWGVFQIFQVGCLVFTAILALNNKIQVGDIVLYQNYFGTIVNQVSSLITLIPVISKGLESVTSIGEILYANDIEDNKDKLKLKKIRGAYEFKDIRFAYPPQDQYILNGLNLKVNPGETIALVGESGAGKSTILNMIIGFILPTSGEMSIDGHNLKEIDLRTYRNHIAVVPQETILFSGSIRDNITYGLPSYKEKHLQEVIKAANLTDLIETLPKGLDTMIGGHGDKLSGGQKQRISIARALIRDPKVIILDEATSALDTMSEKLIKESLNHLIQDRTTFIVAHRLSTILEADKICVIKKGVLVEHGTYEELMAKKGEFYQMKSIQS